MDRTAIKEWLLIAILFAVLLFILSVIGVMWYQTFQPTYELKDLYPTYDIGPGYPA